MKNRSIGVMLLVALVALAIAQQASAVTVDCNVAAGKPVTSCTLYSASYPAEDAVEEWLYKNSLFIGNEGINSWWKVDLEQAYDVDAITIYRRVVGNYSSTINGAWLRAYDASDVQIGSETVISGFSDDAGAPTNLTFDNGGAGWDGARYFLVGGADGKGVNYLALREFQAHSQVETYPNFITGITATTTNLYANGAYESCQLEFTVDNTGMTDQDGPLVGDPNALHRMINGAAWFTGTLELGETPSITFDLGGSCDLDRMLIWNSNQALTTLDRGVNEALIEVSQNGTDWTALPDTNDAGAGNYTINQSPANDLMTEIPYSCDVDLTGLTENVNHVRITALSSYGAAGYWGLTEVRFYGDKTVDTIPGDANNSGTVDAADAQILAGNWGASGAGVGWAQGDFNGDQTVDAADASIMAANWGYGPGEAAAVPEPSTLVLLLALPLVTLFRRQH